MHRLSPLLLVPLLASCASSAPAQKGPSPAPAAEAASAGAAASSGGATATHAWAQARPVVIRHATVMPATGPAIPDGAVAFADGKILAVGRDADVATPPGAEEVDGRGLFVTPGIIDGHSHLGVYASPSSFSNDDGNEATAPVTAEVNAMHSYWPQDPGLRRAAAGGVTSLLVLPGSANLVGGRGFPVKLHFGRAAADVRFPGAKDSLKMACGENPRRVYGQGRKSAPATRMANVAGFRTAFLQARAYLEAQDAWEEKHRKDPKTAGPRPTRDLRNETLAEVLRGNVLVQNHCYRADEMDVMLRLADEFGFSIRAFHHALEAYKLRDRLAQKGTATATWADWWGFKLEAWDGIPENAGLLQQAGARVVIHSDSALGIQRLNQEAGKARASALARGIAVSEEQALRWVTLDAAWLMGVDDKTGSLEVGKMADVVLWKGHPLSSYARAQRVWADGLVTYDAATGASDVSDFEVGAPAQGAAALVAKPADVPRLPVCDGPACLAPVALPDGAAAAACTALTNVTVVSGGQVREGASVVVQGGRVASVGAAGAPAPAGCRAVDGGGRVLTAGLVDPLTQVGLVDVLGEEGSNDVSPKGEAAKDAVRAALRAADSFNPDSATLAVARAGGVTGVGMAPSGGLVSGQSALAGTDGVLRRTPLALHVNLGGGAGRDAAGTRGLTYERLRELLTDAREYARRRQDFERAQMRDVAASRLDLEALQPVLAGRLPVVAHVDRASDIRATLALAREFGLKLVVAGASEAWRMAPELAAAKVPVVLQPTQNLPASFDALGSRLDAAALLSAAGVKVVISTLGEPHNVRTLPQEAGNAVAWGLPYAQAVDAVTRNALEAFGLEGGTVAPGAPADLVLWSGDPLDTRTKPVGVWVNGQQQPLTNRQDALFQKYKQLK